MIAEKSPLEGRSIGNKATVAIRELAGVHATDLRVAPGMASYSTVQDVLGMSLPGKSGLTVRAAARDGAYMHVLCLAPDWWLLVGATEAEEKLLTLRSNEDVHVSVVDVSGQRTIIELEGPQAREVLAHLWEQDLRDRSFPVGSVSQGLIAKAPVIVHHVADMQYRVMVRSSFAMHVWNLLEDAAVEWW